MEYIIGFIVIAAILYAVFSKVRESFERAKNTVMGIEGNCVNCCHCCVDEKCQISPTGYYCRLSKCENITPETVMPCMEKPKVTEGDLNELFALGIWNESGKQYIRNTILGERMLYEDVDEFLKRIPVEHPEFIDQEYLKNNRN